MNKKLVDIRRVMKEFAIDFMILPNTDPHISEYVSEHFRFVEYISGFTGSNATLVITENEAGLWTDGRYFVQAEEELRGSDIDLYKMGIDKAVTIEEFIKKRAKSGNCIGFDGRFFTKKEYDKYSVLAQGFDGIISMVLGLFDEVFSDRPPIKSSDIYVHPYKYCGMKAERKIEKLREKIAENGADSTIIADLCQIAWLLNLRGSDIDYMPVFYSYLYVDMENVCLFAFPGAMDAKVKRHIRSLSEKNKIFDYQSFYTRIERLKNKKILIDPEYVNSWITDTIESKNEIIYKESPIDILKAKKNKTEIENTKRIHIIDGVAVTRFIYRLKNSFYKNITENEVSKKIYELRSDDKEFISESFATISAYGPNAAMMHYNPENHEDVFIENKGFLLIDSGAHYMGGTTDITRTISMGKLSDKQREYYTLVLKSHLALMDAKFKSGATGLTLDMLSRKVFWERGLDYLSGTGHGVGHVLSVHEGPANIGYRVTKLPAVVEEGMVLTDEPGYYEDGKFGIRIENELLCVPYMKSRYGSFLSFESLTLVPYERDAIKEELLNEDEKRIFNKYNKSVFEKLSPYMDEDEKLWLAEVTKSIE